MNQEDIVDALVSEKVRCYVTDFPTKEIVGVRGAIVIPHLGASTEESEDNCAKMAAAEVKDFLENGNITHSVNSRIAIWERKEKERELQSFIKIFRI